MSHADSHLNNPSEPCVFQTSSVTGTRSPGAVQQRLRRIRASLAPDLETPRQQDLSEGDPVLPDAVCWGVEWRRPCLHEPGSLCPCLTGPFPDGGIPLSLIKTTQQLQVLAVTSASRLCCTAVPLCSRWSTRQGRFDIKKGQRGLLCLRLVSCGAYISAKTPPDRSDLGMGFDLGPRFSNRASTALHGT